MHHPCFPPTEQLTANALPVLLLGVAAAGCHTTFIECINKHLKEGNKGFSARCPYDEVVPVMERGIQLTLALTGAFRANKEL